MNLDRALIKQQAKDLIKGKVFILFLIIFVVSLLTNINSLVKLPVELSENKSQSFSDILPGDGNEGDLEQYFKDFDPTEPTVKQSPLIIALSALARVASLVAIAMGPLEIMLCGMFLLLVNGKRFELYDEFDYVFKNTFSKDYFDKLLLSFLSKLFTLLLCFLFVIPGVIYAYKIYFAFYISAENPKLTWKDALTISKKMTNNHKGELFVLDLSFIPWILLVVVTFGIAGIYVNPYVQVTKALYYENFKRRAMMTGEITEADFMSEQEKYSQFVQSQNGNAAQNFYQTQPPVQQYTQYQAQTPVQAPPVMPNSVPAPQPAFQQPVVQVQQPVIQPPYVQQQYVQQPQVQTYFVPVTPAVQPQVQPVQPQVIPVAQPAVQPVQQPVAQPIVQQPAQSEAVPAQPETPQAAEIPPVEAVPAEETPAPESNGEAPSEE